MTIGDVLAVIASIIGIVLSSWAAVIALALLFPARSSDSGDYLEQCPWRSLLSGLALALTAGGLAVIVLQQPNGLVKLVGWVLLSALLGLGAIGAGGMARLLARRLALLDQSASPLSSLVRGTVVLLVAGLLPILGWFAITPLAYLASLGAGFHTVVRRRHRPVASAAAGSIGPESVA